MNKEIVILREAINKIIPMIAGKGLKVTQIGTGAYVKAHPSTGVPYLVNIPSIPDNATPEFVTSIQGFIDHEVSHVLFTDFSYKMGQKSRRLHSLHNVFEDTMIERKMADKFSGSKRNLATLRAWFCENITKPALASAKSEEEAFGYLLVVAMRALAGHREMKDFLDDNNLWAQPLLAALMSKMPADFVKRIPLLNSTAETYDAAVQLEAILYPPPPPAPPQPEPQPEEQDEDESGEGDQDHSDEEQTGDGEGEGEREHTEDNENASGGEEEEDDDMEIEEQELFGDEDEDEDAGEGEKSADEETEADADSDSSDDGDDDASGEEDAEGDADGSEDEADEDAGEDERKGSGKASDKDGDADDADDENGSGKSSDDDDDGDQEEDSGDAADGSQASEPDEDAEGDDGETDTADQSDGSAESEVDDQDDESDGDAGGGDADGETEEGDEADDESDAEGGSDVAVETDSDDDGDGAEKPEEENEEGVAGVGYDEHNPFEALDDDDLVDKDLSSSIAILIQKEAIKAILSSEYSVLTRQYDRIEPLPVPETFAQEHVTRLDDATRQMTGVMQKDIERMMAAQSRVFKVGGQRSGRLNGPGLHRIMSNDDRVFARREEIKAKDTAVSLLMDCSGSMEGAKQATAVSASYALATTLERVNIPCECLGFTTMGYIGRNNTQQWPLSHRQWEELMEHFNAEVAKGVTFHRFMPIFMPVFKGFQERVNAEIKRRFAYMQIKQPHQGGNIDGESLEYAAMRLAQRKEKRKVIIVLSDGHPAGALNDSEHLKMMAERLTKQGYDLVGIGIKDHAVSRFYDKHVVLQDIADLPGEVMKQLRVILQK
jgi:hypothetical protein